MNNRATIDRERGDRDALETALLSLRATIRGKSCTCPYHEDRNPSASIIETPGGAWKVYCHVCQQGWDVWDLRAKASGRDPADLFRSIQDQGKITQPIQPRASETLPMAYANVEACAQALGKIWRATWVYNNPDTGHVDLVVYRVQKSGDKKQYWQGHQSDRGIILKKPEGLTPLYRRDVIRKTDRVVIVEGEKCADALNAIGIPATTAAGGAGKADLTDWSAVAGKKCIIWPDNDPVDERTGKRTGIDHMKDVARILSNIHPAPSVYWLEVDGLGLPPKGDVADLLDAMDAQDSDGCRTTIVGILEEAGPLGASAGVSRIIEETISGKRFAAPWPWPQMTQLTKALLPGTVTIVCGAAGSTKSFFLLQCLAFWCEKGIPSDIYELEDDRDYHLYRALAQEASDSRVFDDEWVRGNPDEVRAIFTKHKQFLDEIGPRIWDSSEEQRTLKQLAEWVKQRCDAGKRIIVIDPITAANTEEKPWAEDLVFMMAIKKYARESGASIILVTHPKKGSGQAKNKIVGMDDMAGGAAYQRFAHTILYLEAFESKPMILTTQDQNGIGTEVASVNRSIRICKARNGRGAGMALGLHFNGGALRFRALGVIQGAAQAERKKDQQQPRAARMSSKPGDGEDIF